MQQDGTKSWAFLDIVAFHEVCRAFILAVDVPGRLWSRDQQVNSELSLNGMDVTDLIAILSMSTVKDFGRYSYERRWWVFSSVSLESHEATGTLEVDCGLVHLVELRIHPMKFLPKLAG